jgi:O-acetylhomoserine (thiol)-lyase
VLNIPVLAEVAHQHGLPLMIDSTFTTPYLCRPFDLGADIIFHSATKFLSGHGVVIGGLLVDSGTFDWETSGKFPTMTEPYAGFHDMNFAVEFGPAAFITRARKEGARDFGACMSPTTAFQVLQGMETLPIMQQHFLTSNVPDTCTPESPIQPLQFWKKE